MDNCPKCQEQPCRCPKKRGLPKPPSTRGSIPADSLNQWCQVHSLSALVPKLRENAGIQTVAELQELCASAEDIAQIISDCQMNVGDKLRFRAAMKQLSASQQQEGLQNLLNSSQILAKPLTITVNGTQYQLLGELGKGGFGVVWKAIDVKTNDVVAIKQVLPDPNSPKNWFKNEIEAHQAVTHPSVPRVPKFIRSSSEAESEQYFVIEFIPGETADVHYKYVPEYILSGVKATKFLLKTLETLDAIHRRGIIHRDIKPGNTMIHKYTLEPWIFDFGISREVILRDLGKATDVGTLAFRPPEYPRDLNWHTDIYSLGATILALTGLITADDLMWDSVLERCPWTNDLKTVVGSMIAYDVPKRFQNCQDAISALNKTLVAPTPVVASPTQDQDLVNLRNENEGLKRTLLEKTVQHNQMKELMMVLEKENSILKREKANIEQEYANYKKEKETFRVKLGDIVDDEPPSEPVGVRPMQPAPPAGFSASNPPPDPQPKADPPAQPKTFDPLKESLSFQAHTTHVRCVTELAGGGLASGSDDKTIKFWDVNAWICMRTLKGHAGSVCCILQLKDGTLASGSDDETIKVWDLFSAGCLRTIQTGASVLSIAELPDGTLASGSEGNTIKIWDPSGTVTCMLRGHTKKIRVIIKLSDGTLASGSNDNTIKIWDPKSDPSGTDESEYEGVRQCLRTLEGHTNNVCCIAQLFDTLASGSEDNTIRIWDPKIGTCLRVLTGHTNCVASIIRFVDGTIVSSSYDHTIKIWDPNAAVDKEASEAAEASGATAGGTCLQTLEGHTSPVSSIVRLFDGTLASGSFDNTIKIWNSTPGQPTKETCIIS